MTQRDKEGREGREGREGKQGRPSGKSVIMLVGGPKNQRVYEYPTPLPKTVVFNDIRNGKHDTYYRKPQSCTYIHSDLVPTETARKALGLQ